VQCLQLALAATDDDTLPRLFAGPSGQAALANHSWSYVADDGSIDGWVLSESFQPGSSAGVGHDGSDLFANLVGTQHVLDFVDIEITEAWYPMQVVEKRAAPGPHGAGHHRSGSGCRMSYRVTGDRRLTGAMFAMRETIPVGGVAGGLPGAPTEFRIRRADGTEEVLAAHQSGVVLDPGDVFEFEAGSGGGYGDPLERDAEAVRRDVVVGRLSRGDATATYGVVLDADGAVDPAATAAARTAVRRARLAAARPPASPVAPGVVAPEGGPVEPLYHGIEQRGPVAVAVESGAVLAVAPGQWSDGCAALDEPRRSPTGSAWIRRTYLDPVSGAALFVEAVPEGAGRAFSSEPARWAATGAAQAV
jgi:N-methylhydantoinase B